MTRRIRFERHCGYWPAPKQASFNFLPFTEDAFMPLPRGPDPIPTDSPEWFDLVQGKRGQGAAPPVEAKPSLCDHGRSLAVRCEDCGARFVRAMESLANRLSPGGQGTPPSEPDPLVRPAFAWPHRVEP